MGRWTYQEAADYIGEIPRFAKEKSMQSLERILHSFGDPQESFSYIHTAGTNGKGSVCSYLDSMLRRAGVRTGLFTSPHLVTMRERIRIDGKMVDEETFLQAFEKVYDFVKAALEDPESGIVHPTFFEWIYLMAVICFADAGIQYGIIETGLGGRLDATNVVKRPVLTVITSISLDHMQYLGETIPQIAAEKAGIIKRGVPLICDAQDPAALPVLTEKALQMEAPSVYVFAEEEKELIREQIESLWKTDPSARCLLVKKILNQGKNIDFYLQEMYHDIDNVREKGEPLLFSLPTTARYQAVNASLAYLAFRSLASSDPALPAVSDRALEQALSRTYWPARMDEIMPGILIDGAHNEAGVRALCDSLQAACPGRPVILLFGVSADKDYRHMVRILAGFSGLKAVVTTAMKGSRTASGERLRQLFEEETKGRVPCCSREDVPGAFSLARSLMTGDDLLVCAGSLYMAGEIMALNIVPPERAD